MLEAALPASIRPTPSAYVYYVEGVASLYDSRTPVEYVDIKLKPNKISLETQIAMEVGKLDYTISDIQESEFEDMGKSFKVYTVELADTIEDYALLLQKEKEIRRTLGLYDKNIILELV